MENRKVPAWQSNLLRALRQNPVVIVHGNVRDRYVDAQGAVHENLDSLFGSLRRQVPLRFRDILKYDICGQERRSSAAAGPPNRAAPAGDPELAGTAPAAGTGQRIEPSRVLAAWEQELRRSDRATFAVINYLDKLIAYASNYSEPQREILLRLERIVENIAPPNRLVLVALQDTMVPVELYQNSPRVAVILVPRPGRTERQVWLRHALGDHSHLDLLANLTDGMFLRDLENIAVAVRDEPDAGPPELRRIVNRHRLGDQDDHWAQLDIRRLNGAEPWFVGEGGVKGQDHAVARVVEKLVVARAGLIGMERESMTIPKAGLFFVGPSGVGKTLLAKKLARFIFGSEDAFHYFAMSEYKEEHSISKLIGSPPGYVGHERGGALTNAVRERPFSVVLLDEIEKAHPRILDLFLQILDEGRLTDSHDKTVWFTEAILIFTSNIGTRTHDSRNEPVEERSALDGIRRHPGPESREAIRNHFTTSVERFFASEISRPELLNRLGKGIVPFDYIDAADTQREIITTRLDRMAVEFAEKHRQAGFRLVHAPEVIEHLLQKAGRVIAQSGGRGAANVLADEVLPPLARALLCAEDEGRRQVTFRLACEDARITVSEEPAR